MNISRENLDELNAQIKIQIEPSDYTDKVNNVLRDYRKKASFDGFRPGKVPFGMVKKLYGKSALLDEVNKLLSENLSKYLTDNKLRILGEPLPSEDSPSIDWDTQNNFDFAFDIAISPEFELSLSKKDKVKLYKIEVDDKVIDEQTEQFCQRFGSYEPTEKAENNDLIKGDLIQLDENAEALQEGLRAEDALVSISTIADEEIKSQFIGIQANDDIVFDPAKAFPNEADRAAMFKIKKEELENVNGQFKLTVGEVSRFQAAKINQDLFDKSFGEGNISSLEEYRDRIKKDIEMQFSQESSYKFHVDARDKLVDKMDFDLPDDFLKRWMLATTKDETLTMEKIEEEYPDFKKDLRWQLIKEKIIEEQSIKAEQEEVKAFAIQDARNRFRQYGMYDVPDDQLAGLAESILASKEEERKIIDNIHEDKVINFVREMVKVEEKPISLDGFKKLFE